jgi:hypothetical protein
VRYSVATRDLTPMILVPLVFDLHVFLATIFDSWLLIVTSGY